MIRQMYQHFHKIAHFLSIISIFFLFYYLVDEKLYILNFNIDFKNYLLSLFFLLLGHIIYIYGLHQSLNISKPNFSRILEAEFLSIFNKYIPGKILTIVGPLSYLKKSFPSLSLKNISISYLYYQVILIWAGFAFGLFFLYKIDNINFILYLIILLIISCLIFCYKLQMIIYKLWQYFFNQDISFLATSFTINIKTIISTFSIWFSWSLAFYFFCLAYYIQLDFYMSFLFPLAATIGILAVFTPGGLGVRESFLILLLVSYGIEKITALQLSIDARLWFLIGEILSFLIGLISALWFNYLKRNNQNA